MLGNLNEIGKTKETEVLPEGNLDRIESRKEKLNFHVLSERDFTDEHQVLIYISEILNLNSENNILPIDIVLIDHNRGRDETLKNKSGSIIVKTFEVFCRYDSRLIPVPNCRVEIHEKMSTEGNEKKQWFSVGQIFDLN